MKDRVKLRTRETYERYMRDMRLKKTNECPLCSTKGTKYEFDHWVIVPNDYPYDYIFSVSDMLVPRRHFKHENEMTVEEMIEFSRLKNVILEGQEYDVIQENCFARKTVAPHYHIHLLKYAPEDV